MTRGEGACLVCGKPIIYFDKAKKMKCIMCHKTFESYASCEDGHFVCDECHAKKGIDMVMEDERVIIRTKLEKPSKIKGLALI